MERIIVASLLLLLAFAATVEGRMAPGVFDDDTPKGNSVARELIGEDDCQRTCDQVCTHTMHNTFLSCMCMHACECLDRSIGLPRLAMDDTGFAADALWLHRMQVHFRTICRSLTKLPGVTTPRELLLASMRVAAEKAKEAKRHVDEYKAKSHEGRPMSSILGSCIVGYRDVVQTLEEAQKLAAAPGPLVDLNTKLSDAITSASDCDNGFQDFPEMKSPFLAIQKNVYRLVDNVLNIFVVVKQSEDLHAHEHH